MFIELVRLRPPTPQPSIHENIADEPLGDVVEVVRYLAAGHLLISAMSSAGDVFDPSEIIVSGDSVLTDGDWLWRDDLAHYVSRHNVILPDEFLALLRGRGYIVPDVEHDALVEASNDANHLMFYGEQFGE